MGCTARPGPRVCHAAVVEALAVLHRCRAGVLRHIDFSGHYPFAAADFIALPHAVTSLRQLALSRSVRGAGLMTSHAAELLRGQREYDDGVEARLYEPGRQRSLGLRPLPPHPGLST